MLRIITVLACVVVALPALPLRAEIVPKTAEEMREMATHVVQGKVKGVYASSGKAGDYQQTHYVAELTIERIEKGDGLKEKQLIYVRYWTQRWAGRVIRRREPTGIGVCRPSETPSASTSSTRATTAAATWGTAGTTPSLPMGSRR